MGRKCSRKVTSQICKTYNNNNKNRNATTCPQPKMSLLGTYSLSWFFAPPPCRSMQCNAMHLHSFSLQYCTLLFETCVKLGKLQCKSNFNRNKLLLLDNFETNPIVLYLRGGYIMHLETTCHMSHVRCSMTLFNHSQTVRAMDQLIVS